MFILEYKWWFEEKIKDEKFKNFICTYDIAFLSECWINNTCNIEIDDCVCKSIPLSRKKCKQGCGMYVMIRKILSPYIKIIDISYETLIWIRIAKELTGCESDY